MKFSQKHEPQHFNQLVFADLHVKKQLLDYANGIRNGHILLHGDYGLAKSTTARLIAKNRLCRDVPLACVDILSATDFDKDINPKLERISNGWGLQQFNGQSHPVAIIDEVHLLSPMTNQYKLRAFMDQAKHGSFIFTANQTASIDAGILNRCDVVEIKPLTSACALAACQRILRSEGVVLSDQVVGDLLDTTDFSWRDILRALEQAVIAYKKRAASKR